CGYPLVLTDTAGLREGSDAVEKLGVERTRSAIETADEIWFIYESHLGWLSEDQSLLNSLPRRPSLLLANKSDLPLEGDALASPTPQGLAKASPSTCIRLSAITGDGLDAIEAHVRDSFEEGAQGEPPLINERHRDD